MATVHFNTLLTKKVICSKVETLRQEDLHKVVGGSSDTDRMQSGICTALTGGKAGNGKGASSGSPCDGCGSQAKTMHDAAHHSSSGSSGGSSRGSSRVICTYFYKKGLLDKDTWRADLEFTEQHLSSTTVRGYHFWAIPYVELMRKHSLAEKIMLPIAKYRAYELAHKMGIRRKGSTRGKLIRLILEPSCYLIGLFCEQKDWEKLWAKQ